jgi:tRNA pseudouridine38-40 synthase
MRKILLQIQYKGTAYHGWQVQKGKKTVQGELQRVLSDFLRENVVLVASGRTDAGVHARAQYAHFETKSSFDFSRLPMAVARLLPPDIAIVSAVEVPNTFHARFGAKQKTYHYMCYISQVRLPLLDEFALQIKQELDVELMQQEAQNFVGTHDFSSFSANPKDPAEEEDFADEKTLKQKTNIRTIYSCDIEQTDNIITFKITGNGFLHNMVRIMVGTLIEIGQGKITTGVKHIISEKDRECAGQTMPPHGLVLHDVKYN